MSHQQLPHPDTGKGLAPLAHFELARWSLWSPRACGCRSQNCCSAQQNSCRAEHPHGRRAHASLSAPACSHSPAPRPQQPPPSRQTQEDTLQFPDTAWSGWSGVQADLQHQGKPEASQTTYLTGFCMLFKGLWTVKASSQCCSTLTRPCARQSVRREEAAEIL